MMSIPPDIYFLNGLLLTCLLNIIATKQGLGFGPAVIRVREIVKLDSDLTKTL